MQRLRPYTPCHGVSPLRYADSVLVFKRLLISEIAPITPAALRSRSDDGAEKQRVTGIKRGL